MSKDKPAQIIEDVNRATTGQPPTKSAMKSYKPRQDPNPTVELDPNFKAPKELLKAQSLANVLDTAVKIPIINLSVGLDFLVGLVPVVGDSIMLLSSMRIIHLGHKLGMPSALKYKMMKNAAIDYGLGFVPIVGDIVDMFYKANQKNVRVIEKWWVSQNKAQIDALAKHQLDAWQKEQDKA